MQDLKKKQTRCIGRVVRKRNISHFLATVEDIAYKQMLATDNSYWPGRRETT